MSLPVGTLTFMFTDVESSTRLWELYPDRTREALVRHDMLFEGAVLDCGGFIVKPRGEGDSRFAVFHEAANAVYAAAAFQRGLHEEAWTLPTPLRVRVGLHTGESDLRDGDYYGSDVNRCARLRAIAHGGQTVLSAATARLAEDSLPDGVSLRDMGDHRLKDLTRPEHVFQLVLSGVPSDFPPLMSVDAFPNNLPVQLTRFIGRERELAEIKRLLAETRLLTLTGPGGTGKTRLSLQTGADLLETYKYGAWMVELAPVTDPDLVPNTIASVFNLQAPPGVPMRDQLATYLKDKQLLLVLDNCEHLVAACADIASFLLRQCPNLQILASSREALGVLGETAWSVPSLSVPDVKQVADVSLVEAFEAVQLFADRAMAVRPDFALTAQNVSAVTHIVQRLDGIPLAIELATSRLRGLSVEQIASRLDDRFRLLTGGNRTALPRHQTLRTLIDWSHELLSPQEQILLRRLSAFMGGWTLEAAEAVCADDQLQEVDVLDLLLGLVNKSLVVVEEQDGDTRYRMLETIRQYARDKLLDAGEGVVVRDRHLAFFVEFAERLEPLQRTHEQLRTFARLDAEADNLRAALEWAADGETPELALSMLYNQMFYWFRRGYFSEAIEWGRRLFAATEGTHSFRRGLAMLAVAVLCARMGNFEGAQRYFAEGLKQTGDDSNHTLVILGKMGLSFGTPYLESRPQLEKAIALARSIGDTYLAAEGLFLLGDRMRVAGDLDDAERAYQESIALYRQIGVRHEAIYPLGNLGRLAMERGDYAAARPYFEQSVAVSREYKSRLSVADWLVQLSVLNVLEGKIDTARETLYECLEVSRELGNLPGVGDCLVIAAGLALLEAQPEHAARLLGASARFRNPEAEFMSEPEGGAKLAYFVQKAREALGDIYDCFYAEGEAMTTDFALAMVLGADKQTPAG